MNGKWRKIEALRVAIRALDDQQMRVAKLVPAASIRYSKSKRVLIQMLEELTDDED